MTAPVDGSNFCRPWMARVLGPCWRLGLLTFTGLFMLSDQVAGLNPKGSHSGARAKAPKPGIDNLDPSYGFRARRCGAPRNDRLNLVKRSARRSSFIGTVPLVQLAAQ